MRLKRKIVDLAFILAASITLIGCQSKIDRLEADGKCVATIEFDLDRPSGVFTALSEALSGAHDAYFVFSNRNIGFYNWQFL